MKFYLFLITCLVAGQAAAVISVQDDAGNTVVLPRAAQRIVTLAPHTTELVFAAGGGDRIVGHHAEAAFEPLAGLGVFEEPSRAVVAGLECADGGGNGRERLRQQTHPGFHHAGPDHLAGLLGGILAIEIGLGVGDRAVRAHA